VLLFEALLAGLDSILDHLLKLDSVYSKEDICQPLAVQSSDPHIPSHQAAA
jgi:hypothetical protein